MKDILSGWREHGLLKSKSMFISIILMMIFIMISVGAYYIYQKKIEEEKREYQKQQLVINEKKKISDFYTNQSHGYQFHDLINILEQIMVSRYAFTLSGYSEDMFNCDTNGCNFLYKLKPGAIFNVQEKTFFNENYDGTISSDSIEFSGLNISHTDGKIIENIINQINYNVPLCNDYINYIYAFNSSKHYVNDRITLVELPSSSVVNLEQKYPNFENSHNLLFSKFEMVLPENPLKIEKILERQPYINFYIFKSIEKLDSNNIKVTGVFTCTR
ncbi:hypothetical protein [Providencia sp.]|uniref:hypothetical protein n=1 Tax=Providencia sp. TaxID=589 RepID=UPI0035AE6534